MKRIDDDERESPFVRATLKELADTYDSLLARMPAEPPEFETWRSETCASLRRRAARLRAGRTPSPNPAYTPVQMAEVLENIAHFQRQIRAIIAEYRKAQVKEADLNALENHDALKERLAMLVNMKHMLSDRLRHLDPDVREAFIELDHKLRNQGARRGTRIRPAEPLGEPYDDPDDIDVRRWVNDFKQGYIHE